MDFISILFLFFIILIATIFTGIFYDAIWLSTRKKDYDRIAQLANLQPKMTFYDLGSGNANMLFYLSKKYDVKCVGIEISPALYLYSKFRTIFYKKVEIKYGNLYKYNISEGDVIYIFLLPRAYPELKKKVEKELKKGGKLILSCWPFKNREPNKIAKKEGAVTYYLYQN